MTGTLYLCPWCRSPDTTSVQVEGDQHCPEACRHLDGAHIHWTCRYCYSRWSTSATLDMLLAEAANEHLQGQSTRPQPEEEKTPLAS